MTIIPLVPASLTGSSNLPGSADGPSDQLPYLVLLRAGFGLPRLLPGARCALTAPFHPYPSTRLRRLTASKARSGRYIFCATVRRVAPPGCYPAHCPVEFGLSSPAGTSFLAERLPAAAIARLTAANYYPSLSCEIWYCSSFLYRLLRGVSITSAVFEIFQPFSRSRATR